MSQGNQHGPSKQLTLDLVFTKTKSDSLQNIKNLNLWGNQLQDLSLIEKMPNLEVVSLSVNRISSLRDFSKCPKLQQLYLRKNNITDLSEIAYLMKLPNLKVLWLHDNPCALTEHYREIVIKHLPSLMKLDNNPVSPEDKINAQKININYQRKEDKPAHNHSVYQEEGQSRAADPRWPKKNTYNVPENKKNQEKVSRPEDKYLPKQDERAQFKQEEKIQQGKADERGQQARQEYQQLSQQDYGQKSKQEYMQQGRQQYSQGKPQQRYQLKPQQRYRQQVVGKQGQTPLSKLNVKEVQRNQNIVMAILTLLQELDQSSLEIVKREAEKLLES